MSIFSIFGSAADRVVISFGPKRLLSVASDKGPKRLLSAASDKGPIAASASVLQTRSFQEGTAESCRGQFCV